MVKLFYEIIVNINIKYGFIFMNEKDNLLWSKL